MRNLEGKYFEQNLNKMAKNAGCFNAPQEQSW